MEDDLNFQVMEIAKIQLTHPSLVELGLGLSLATMLP
jgi:hypothetical protein